MIHEAGIRVNSFLPLFDPQEVGLGRHVMLHPEFYDKLGGRSEPVAWSWDQGRLAYFQFDALRKIAKFVTDHDFMRADRHSLFSETGLNFQAPSTHSPWRNYSRVLKLCLLASAGNGRAEATPVARILSQPGVVTCDEYLHFLVCASSSPSPALQGWRYNAPFRYPLLFSLKYLLTKAAINVAPVASLNEIIGAYRISGFTGDEDANGLGVTLILTPRGHCQLRIGTTLSRVVTSAL